MAEGFIEELANRMRLAGGNDKVVRLGLLQHEPDCFHVVFCVTPVSLGFEISKKQFVLSAELDSCRGLRNLPAHERFTATRRFVVEEDAIACEEPVTFA